VLQCKWWGVSTQSTVLAPCKGGRAETVGTDMRRGEVRKKAHGFRTFHPSTSAHVFTAQHHDTSARTHAHCMDRMLCAKGDPVHEGGAGVGGGGGGEGAYKRVHARGADTSERESVQAGFCRAESCIIRETTRSFLICTHDTAHKAEVPMTTAAEPPVPSGCRPSTNQNISPPKRSTEEVNSPRGYDKKGVPPSDLTCIAAHVHALASHRDGGLSTAGACCGWGSCYTMPVRSKR
jgi:hypothetical protein